MALRRHTPRRNHVRTGCITCKRRRVKCSEEHPSCSRCIRAGFTCAGYAAPEAWIFEGSAEAQAGSSIVQSSESEYVLSVSPRSQVEPPQGIYRTPRISMYSPLQLGNSDSFDSYAIHIGPRENHLLLKYRVLGVLQNISCTQPNSSRNTGFDGWKLSTNCLCDETAACGLLARNAALDDWMSKGPGANPSWSSLDYLIRTQSALCRSLPLLDASESLDIVSSIMWATSFLTSVAIITQSWDAPIHTRIMSKAVTKYVELMGDSLDEETILQPVYVDIMSAIANSACPTLDMIGWFPRVFSPIWNAAWRPRSSAFTISRVSTVHSDLKNSVVKDILISLRNGYEGYVDSFIKGGNYGAMRLSDLAIRSRELLYYGQLLSIAREAEKCLEDPNLDPDSVQNHSVQAYLAFATLLWLQLISPTRFVNNALFDATPKLLQQLQLAILKSRLDRSTSLVQFDTYSYARIWALFIGVQIEKGREALGVEHVCEDWFRETFHSQAISLQIQTWQQAITVFEQFLYSDQMQPHISRWW